MVSPLRAWIVGLAATMGLVLGTAAERSSGDPRQCAMPPRPDGLVTAVVQSVLDGDTLIVRLADGRDETVRLIGIDTPESHESEKLRRQAARTAQGAATIQVLGRRAATYTASELPRGHRVGLELDIEWRDSHGRLLAYVWRYDGTLVNLAILEAGYAQLLTIAPNVRHAERFRTCLSEARAAGRGLWSRR
jgi:micrococcal nuclease